LSETRATDCSGMEQSVVRNELQLVAKFRDVGTFRQNLRRVIYGNVIHRAFYIQSGDYS
jgi:hypothetical protein